MPDGIGLPYSPSDLKMWMPESQAVSDARSEERPRFGMESRSSFRSEMTGCLWSALIQIVLIVFCFFLLKLLIGK